MSVIDEGYERDYVIPSWDFEHSLMLHLVDALNERVSISVYESIIESFSKKLEIKLMYSSHRSIFLPFHSKFKVPLVRGLLVHHKEKGMRGVAMANKYGISERQVLRLIQSVKGEL
ncbi:hypothetical protein [Aeromonas salmonicida]|uniref:hypothetical protein n=1 Tax=Aeromonas salmonicida TaxID=645 RepID=UPI00232EF93B|nr:hypothetical protein [Aeromonas salmonicida]WCH26159.1 hypothetical protein ONZ66_16495 [Aeromonas salmonicida]